MKKYLLTFIIVQFFFAGLLSAQQKMWVPYLTFKCDNDSTEKYFLSSAGQDGGDHKFADGTNMVAYHFHLDDFADAQQQHPLSIRFTTWNEFVVIQSETPITNPSEGEEIIKYSYLDPLPEERSGENITLIEIPLQDYYDLGQEELYISFFDGRPVDGWGPSVGKMGLYYEEDVVNIPENAVNIAIGNLDYVTTDGNFQEWDVASVWSDIAKTAANTVTTGTINDDADLSAKASVTFDKDNVYFGLDVKDNDVNGDTVAFYLGLYDITDSLNQFGHLNYIADNGTVLPGLRKRSEPDYRFVVNVDEANAYIYESNILQDTVKDSEVKVVKIADGYRVEAKVPFFRLYIPGTTLSLYALNPEGYHPFAFKIVDNDGGAVEGSLIAGTNGDVDVSPSSWAYKTLLIDNRKEEEGGLVKKVFKSITPGGGDAEFIVEKYPGSKDDQHRWADNQDTVAWHFDVAYWLNKVPGQDVFISFTVGNEYVMNVAGSENGEKDEFAVWSTKGIPEHNENNKKDIEISLTDMQERGYFDLHVFFTDGIPTDGWGASIRGIKIYYKGVPQDTPETEWIPGNDGTEGDGPYLVADNGSGADATHRWADGNSSFGYKFDLNAIKAAANGREPLFKVHIENEYLIKVADSEAGEQTQVAKWSNNDIPEHNGNNAGWLTFSLQQYITDGWENVVFFFYDGISTDGWGPALRNANISYRELLGYYVFDEFIPSTNITSEADYLVEGHEGSGVSDHHRWADNESDITYHFNKADLVGKAGSDNVIVQFAIENEYVVSVKPTMEDTLTQVLIWSEDRIPEHNANNAGTQEVDLKPWFEKGWDDVYLVFTDGIPTDGWGPALHKVSLTQVKPIAVGVKANTNLIPESFEVSQNYPNPFNPTTTIRYAIPEAGKLSVVVYDILGREIKTLVNDFQAAGTYQVTWKGDSNFGSKVASGVYLYRINFNNKQQVTKKMVMLK